MSSSGSLVSGSGHLDMGEIFQLLESSSLSVIDETVELVRDNLGSTPDSWLLNSLVDYYIQSGNSHARDLLCMIRQHQQKALMNKIDEHLQKVSTRLKALNLLNHIIRNEPTWTHHILSSRTFQSVLKCLQVDTDLPTITSALYVVATIMPKVASQISNHLSVVCSIYVRLVSWHTIKPVGANEANLIHVHAAVYALFLCLYGMFPCYFMKYLQNYFQSSSSTKGSNFTDKEKLRIFENSVSPMLDQVRLHPGLIVKTSSVETSAERWRKVESQDIIADISKLALDVTENPVAGIERKMSLVTDANDASLHSTSKTSRTGSDAESLIAAVEQSQEGVWSPSIAIGLSTPPHSRAMSPSPGQFTDSTLISKLEPLQKSECNKEDETSAKKQRPLSLNMSSEAFVPNRPHQTSSASTTPLKHLVPAFLLSSSHSQSTSQSSPQKETTRNKSDQKPKENLGKNDSVGSSTTSNIHLEKDRVRHLEASFTQKEIEPAAEANTQTSEFPDDFVNISKTDLMPPSVKGDISQFSPGLQPDNSNPKQQEKNSGATSAPASQLLSVERLLDLNSRHKYIEKTPNELLDLHISLSVDTYDKFRDRFPVTSNKDVEWQLGDVSSGYPTPEVMGLRSQVLQMHSAMLYERHKREQHALRARKLMRQVYDTAALEEKVKSLSSQLHTKTVEVEDFRNTLKSTQNKLREQEVKYDSKILDLESKLEDIKKTKENLVFDNKKLEREKQLRWEECESLKTESARLGSKLFELEQKFKCDQSNKELVLRMEAKIRELQLRLFESRELNSSLETRVRETSGECKARCLETKLTIEAYQIELEGLRAKCLKNEKSLDLTRIKLEKTEESLQREREVVYEQKDYLENVKSLARGQIKAMEAKYNAQKHISQRLEIEVMELFSRLSAIEGEMGTGERTLLTSGPRSIKAISAVQSDANYQYMYSSSPQLSPPMQGSLLAKVTTVVDDAPSKSFKKDG